MKLIAGGALVSVLLLCLVFVARWWQSRTLATTSNSLEVGLKADLARITDGEKATFLIGNQSLTLEVVKSPARIIQGLSGRPELGADGMLFVMPRTEIPKFWMKDMRFDLDLVWLKNGKVVEVTAQVPAPSPQTPLAQLPIYSPKQPADMVLELEADQAEKWGITPEATLQLK